MDKILIIDSSQQSLDLLSKRLSHYGYDVITADTGNSGFTKAKLFLPDLIILDTNLSDTSGFDICKKIKEHEDTKLILVLFVSSLGSNDGNTRAFGVGADDFIEKNSDSIILISKVKSLLRVSHLIKELGTNYLELQEKNKILDYQLKMGRQVQRSIINDFDFKFNNISFKSKYMPAMDIGGDFYDITQINENCVGVIMGDVSGHGISAALLTAMLNMMFKNLSDSYLDPGLLLQKMNTQFYDVFEKSNNEMYSCIFYAVFDTKKNQIHFANSGHPLPIYFNAKTDKASELESSGVPIGIMKDSVYESHILEFDDGDLFLFHTDGLSDIYFKDSSEEFSKRICNILEDVSTLDSTNEIINIILNVFYNFNATNSEKFALDDVSIILCKM